MPVLPFLYHENCFVICVKETTHQFRSSFPVSCKVARFRPKLRSHNGQHFCVQQNRSMFPKRPLSLDSRANVRFSHTGPEHMHIERHNSHSIVYVHLADGRLPFHETSNTLHLTTGVAAAEEYVAAPAAPVAPALVGLGRAM